MWITVFACEIERASEQASKREYMEQTRQRRRIKLIESRGHTGNRKNFNKYNEES